MRHLHVGGVCTCRCSEPLVFGPRDQALNFRVAVLNKDYSDELELQGDAGVFSHLLAQSMPVALHKDRGRNKLFLVVGGPDGTAALIIVDRPATAMGQPTSRAFNSLAQALSSRHMDVDDGIAGYGNRANFVSSCVAGACLGPDCVPHMH